MWLVMVVFTHLLLLFSPSSLPSSQKKKSKVMASSCSSSSSSPSSFLAQTASPGILFFFSFAKRESQKNPKSRGSDCSSLSLVSLVSRLCLLKMGSRVYVGQLPRDVREKDVERFFKGFDVRDILLKDGFCFVVSAPPSCSCSCSCLLPPCSFSLLMAGKGRVEDLHFDFFFFPIWSLVLCH